MSSVATQPTRMALLGVALVAAVMAGTFAVRAYGESPTRPEGSPGAAPAQSPAGGEAQAPAAKAQEKKSEVVGVFIESVARQVNIAELRKKYPGKNAARIDPEALRADAIVGWYDRGNNYHEQKMEKNLAKEFNTGATKILPQTLKGAGIK